MTKLTLTPIRTVTSKNVVRWIVRGLLHRADGPAVEFPSGNVSWYLDGKWLSFKAYTVAAEWTDEQIIEWKLTHD